MRWLLFFLLCYFLYRYGKYLFNNLHRSTSQQPRNDSYIHYSHSSKVSAQQDQKSSRRQSGEYVDFEEIKE